MGQWAKRLFGNENVGRLGIVLAGTGRVDFENSVLKLFDKVISSKDSVYHAHLVRKNKIVMPIVFNVYGAPAMVDVLTEMYDGGCRNVIFIGYAYGGFRNLEVGSIIIPDRSYHFDGIYHAIRIDKTVALPDRDLKNRLEKLFNMYELEYFNGPNISVPAVTFQLPHNNKEYRRIKPSSLEMELAACYSRAKEIGMRAVGCLVISDNRKSSIGDESKRRLRHAAKMKVLKVITENLKYFRLPSLRTKKFSVDEHLASIVEDPQDMTNVYKNK